MANTNFTLEDVRDVIREEQTGLRTELKSDISGLQTELKGDISGLQTELKGDISGLRTELKSDISGLRIELKSDIDGLRSELKADIGELRASIVSLDETVDSVKTMLEEDAMAESERLTRVEKRLSKTRSELKHHIADKAAHGR